MLIFFRPHYYRAISCGLETKKVINPQEIEYGLSTQGMEEILKNFWALEIDAEDIIQIREGIPFYYLWNPYAKTRGKSGLRDKLISRAQIEHYLEKSSYAADLNVLAQINGNDRLTYVTSFFKENGPLEKKYLIQKLFYVNKQLWVGIFEGK